MTLDLSDEYAVIDNLETLTYTSKVLNQTFPILNANRSKVSRALLSERHFKDVALAGQVVSFNVWINQLPSGFVPQTGDSFTDEEHYSWVVAEVDLATLISRYRLHCLGKK